MQTAGFINVKEDKYVVPIGRWDKDKTLKRLGMRNLLYHDLAIEGLALRMFTSVLGLSNDEVTTFLADLFLELKDPRWLLYVNM